MPTFDNKFFSLHFSYTHLTDIDGSWIAFLICRWLFWLFSFIIWVYFMTFVSKSTVVIKWFVTEFYLQLWLIFRGQGGFTLIPGASGLATMAGAIFLRHTSWAATAEAL